MTGWEVHVLCNAVYTRPPLADDTAIVSSVVDAATKGDPTVAGLPLRQPALFALA